MKETLAGKISRCLLVGRAPQREEEYIMHWLLSCSDLGKPNVGKKKERKKKKTCRSVFPPNADLGRQEDSTNSNGIH